MTQEAAQGRIDELLYIVNNLKIQIRHLTDKENVLLERKKELLSREPELAEQTEVPDHLRKEIDGITEKIESLQNTSNKFSDEIIAGIYEIKQYKSTEEIIAATAELEKDLPTSTKKRKLQFEYEANKKRQYQEEVAARLMATKPDAHASTKKREAVSGEIPMDAVQHENQIGQERAAYLISIANNNTAKRGGVINILQNLLIERDNLLLQIDITKAQKITTDDLNQRYSTVLRLIKQSIDTMNIINKELCATITELIQNHQTSISDACKARLELLLRDINSNPHSLTDYYSPDQANIQKTEAVADEGLMDTAADSCASALQQSCEVTAPVLDKERGASAAPTAEELKPDDTIFFEEILKGIKKKDRVTKELEERLEVSADKIKILKHEGFDGKQIGKMLQRRAYDLESVLDDLTSARGLSLINNFKDLGFSLQQISSMFKSFGISTSKVSKSINVKTLDGFESAFPLIQEIIDSKKAYDQHIKISSIISNNVRKDTKSILELILKELNEGGFCHCISPEKASALIKKYTPHTVSSEYRDHLLDDDDDQDIDEGSTDEAIALIPVNVNAYAYASSRKRKHPDDNDDDRQTKRQKTEDIDEGSTYQVIAPIPVSSEYRDHLLDDDDDQDIDEGSTYGAIVPIHRNQIDYDIPMDTTGDVGLVDYSSE